MLRLSRSFGTSSRLSAAAAAAPAPAAAKPAYAPRRVVARPAPAGARAAATRLTATKTPAARAPYAARAPAAARAAAASSFSPSPYPSRAPAATAAEAPAPAADSFDDFATSAAPFDDIEDYAHLRAPVNSAPSPSPPLQSLPGAGYQPLPPAPVSPATHTNSAPTHTQLRAASQTADIGSESMADGYVFKMPGEQAVEDWTTSFRGLSERPFDREVADALLRPLEVNDVEIKPDGLLYLPEIKYRRTLNAAFGPGGWGMAPRGETHIGPRIVSREWGLVCLGRLVAIARGEQEYFDPSGIPTATEACKSNALMRCCKDLGIASELWDPRFIRDFKAKYCAEAMVEHMGNKRKRKLWRLKSSKWEYPYKEVKF